VTKPTTVDAYLAGVPEPARAVLEGLRRTLRSAAPAAEETIAYDMPALRLDGRFLVSYAAYRHHLSLFPASQGVQDACGDELRPYLAGRGTLQFKADAPLPEALVRKIVKIRLAEVGARGQAPTPPRRALGR
jgi:uncharacterized protein YdhG (YjbR/CyaY superfamily)